MWRWSRRVHRLPWPSALHWRGLKSRARRSKSCSRTLSRRRFPRRASPTCLYGFHSGSFDGPRSHAQSQTRFWSILGPWHGLPSAPQLNQLSRLISCSQSPFSSGGVPCASSLAQTLRNGCFERPADHLLFAKGSPQSHQLALLPLQLAPLQFHQLFQLVLLAGLGFTALGCLLAQWLVIHARMAPPHTRVCGWRHIRCQATFLACVIELGETGSSPTRAL